jgi:hypothetical protein
MRSIGSYGTRRNALRVLHKSRLLLVFLGLTAFGAFVGAQMRPDPHVTPYDELFGQMSVISFRETPSDTTAHFVVDLAGGGKVFRRYDVDTRTFLSASQGRDYNRTITGTYYRPLRVRGHVAQGLWLDVPHDSRPSLLPEQFDELYQATLDYVKPISIAAGVLGTLSGYSVGYRLGAWNSSLRSQAVQERVLATPDIGRLITREAWRRVLLEPAVVGGEDDASRFVAIRGAQRVYANFFRIALHDSDGFIPREAERLAHLGHADESRAMLAFAEAARHAAQDTAQLTSADFGAVERWASLLVRRGHWAYDAMPPAGQERAAYLGMLAWYGVAPPAPDADRVWVGPRLLVREGDVEGFVADEIPLTGVGCPIAWRKPLREDKTGVIATTSAWLDERPEFTALLILGNRAAVKIMDESQEMAARHEVSPDLDSAPPPFKRPATSAASFSSRVTVSTTVDSAHRSLVLPTEAPTGATHAAPTSPDSAARVPVHAGLRGLGIRDRSDPGSCIARLWLAPGQTAATAGEYEQVVVGDGKASVDTLHAPADRARRGLVSVAVLARSAATADSLSGSLLALGMAGAKQSARARSDVSVILIERGADGSDTLWVEAGLRDSFALDEGCSRLRVEYY